MILKLHRKKGKAFGAQRPKSLFIFVPVINKKFTFLPILSVQKLYIVFHYKMVTRYGCRTKKQPKKELSNFA